MRELVFAGKNAEANAYGLKHLTASPTSFRSYEPLGDLWLDFGTAGRKNPRHPDTGANSIWPMASPATTWRQGEATITREVIASAADDMHRRACRHPTNPARYAFTVGLTRHKDAKTTARPDGSLHLDGQIVDVEKKDGGYDDNPGGSGPGGAHMRFAGRLHARVQGRCHHRRDGHAARGRCRRGSACCSPPPPTTTLRCSTVDRALDPAAIAEGILAKARGKDWPALLCRAPGRTPRDVRSREPRPRRRSGAR